MRGAGEICRACQISRVVSSLCVLEFKVGGGSPWKAFDLWVMGPFEEGKGLARGLRYCEGAVLRIPRECESCFSFTTHHLLS